MEFEFQTCSICFQVDSSVVELLSDAQLKELGLVAKGDVAHLRNFCRESSADETTDSLNDVDREGSRKNEKAKLLALLRSKEFESKSRQRQTTALVVAPGRPRQNYRKATVGLRISENGERTIYKNVRAPLGDKNFVSIEIKMTDDYDTLLKKSREVLFPSGVNPVVGALSNFVTTEIVNGHCDNVSELVGGDFTLDKYLTERHIPGAVRFYLLCTAYIPSSEDEAVPQPLSDVPNMPKPRASKPRSRKKKVLQFKSNDTASTSVEQLDDHEGQLPDLGELCQTYFDASPSGEVQVRAYGLLQKDTEDLHSEMPVATQLCSSGPEVSSPQLQLSTVPASDYQHVFYVQTPGTSSAQLSPVSSITELSSQQNASLSQQPPVGSFPQQSDTPSQAFLTTEPSNTLSGPEPKSLANKNQSHDVCTLDKCVQNTQEKL